MNKLPDAFFDYKIGNLSEKITNLTNLINKSSKDFVDITKQFFITSNQEVFHLFDAGLDKANVNVIVHDYIRYYGRYKPLMLDIWFDGLMPYDKIILSNGDEYVDIYVSNLF